MTLLAFVVSSNEERGEENGVENLADRALLEQPCRLVVQCLTPAALALLRGGELASIASHQHEIVWREELCDTFLPLELLNTLHLHPPTNVR